MKYATPHFRWSELECNCGCGTRFVQEEALQKLERLRVLIDTPFSPNSACRCPTYNARVGGAPLSQHRSTETRPSTAFDIPLVVPKQDLIAAAQAVGFGGLGVNYNTFVHVDNRGYKARW